MGGLPGWRCTRRGSGWVWMKVFTLSQWMVSPLTYGEFRRLQTMPSSSIKPLAALLKRLPAPVLAVEMEQIEGHEDQLSDFDRTTACESAPKVDPLSSAP
jgi:hypothetical protein